MHNMPYRTKLFIGINVRELRNCQNREKILAHQNLIPTGACCLKITLKNDKHVAPLGFEPVIYIENYLGRETLRP